MNLNPSCTRRRVLALLAIVVLVALPIRLYLAARAVMVSRDGAYYIWYAQGLAGDPVTEIRQRAHHPLYPAAVLAVHRVLRGAGSIAGGDSRLNDPVTSWVVASMTVTMAGGLAVVVGLYALGAVMFDRRVGLIAAVLGALAAEFCQLSADGLTDMPHLAVYLFAAAAGVHGIERRSHVWLIVTGLLAGLAYLIRPEGAEVAVVTAAGALALNRSWPVRGRIAGAILVCAGAATVASPYMLITGKLVQKKSIQRMFWESDPAEEISADPASAVTDLRFRMTSRERKRPVCRVGPSLALRASDRYTRDQRGRVDGAHPTTTTLAHTASLHLAISPSLRLPLPPSAPLSLSRSASPGRTSTFGRELSLRSLTVAALTVADPKDLARALGRIAENYGRSLRIMFLLPAVAWLILRRDLPGSTIGRRWVLMAGSLHLLILIRLILQFDYWEMFSLRHVMVLTGLTLPFSAAGVGAIVSRFPAERRRVVTAGLLIALAGPTLPWMLEVPHADSAHLRRAGEWIRTQTTGGARVQTTRSRVALYANGVHVPSPPDENPDAILGDARYHHPDYLVFDEGRVLKRQPRFFDDLRASLQPGETLERVHVETHETERGTQRAVVYRYNAPPEPVTE